jgi:hypothetical protein
MKWQIYKEEMENVLFFMARSISPFYLQERNPMKGQNTPPIVKKFSNFNHNSKINNYNYYNKNVNKLSTRYIKP